MSLTVKRLSGLFTVMVVLLVSSTFATILIVIMGTLTTIDSCTCSINEVEAVQTRYISMDPGQGSMCTLYATCDCVCGDSEAPTRVKIKSGCMGGQAVPNTTKTAYHFKASVIYSGYTWERGPTGTFSGIFFSFFITGVALMIISGICMIIIVRKTGRLQQLPTGEEEDAVAAEA